MPKIIDKKMRKVTITIRLSQYVIDALRARKNYNELIEKVLIRELKIENESHVVDK